MAQTQKIVVELSPEFRTILKSIDKHLETLARAKKQQFNIPTTTPHATEGSEEAGS